MSVTECQKLAEVASATTATRALEVGHYLGLSTSVLLNALPPSCELVTIDHHGGDAWVPATSFDEFSANVAPYVGDRSFIVLNEDMATAIPSLDGGFGFVFYDADHSAAAVEQFWNLVVDKLDSRCTLTFDDADWEEQSTLRELAEADGFGVATSIPFVRHDGDKYHASTYTLEIMGRGW